MVDKQNSGARKKLRKARARMRNAFGTELLRTIGSSWARFLAIMGIVGLGAGFYTGLNMTGHDMRLAADAYYDGTRLYDLRVVSTLGLTEDQVDLIRGVDGVENAVGDYATDAMLLLGGKTYATRITSFDVEAARSGIANSNGSAVESDNDSYINRLVLAEGEWPSSADECLLSADGVSSSETTEIGSTVEIVSGTTDIDGVFTRRSYTVTGLAHSAVYPSSATLGYTKLGSGTLKQCMFVCPEAFI